MGEVIQFPLRKAAPEDLAIDLVMLCGSRLGLHLTEWSEIAVFVEHEDGPVGGLLSLEQALELRAALTTMLSAGGYPFGTGGAA
jgi:hypothetical protein